MQRALRFVGQLGLLGILAVHSAIAAVDCGMPPSNGSPPLAAQGQSDVVAVGVMDGDTFAAMIDGDRRRVRLARIDAPEKKQPYGRRAEQALRNLIWGQSLHVEWRTLDRHCRPIAEVTVDGKNVSDAMVAQGMAWQYRAYSHDPALARLEAAARSDRLGLWADPHPVPPWEWRHGRGTASASPSPE